MAISNDVCGKVEVAGKEVPEHKSRLWNKIDKIGGLTVDLANALSEVLPDTDSESTDIPIEPCVSGLGTELRNMNAELERSIDRVIYILDNLQL